MNFWPDFVKIKTAIGGNREHYGYEESFGLPLEEQLYITVPNKHNKRIISELEFAIRLNETVNGRFDSCISEAIAFLLSRMETDGVLTKASCDHVEQILMPCHASAKEYKLILAGHAHIDMDWMWSYQETVAITLSTFRTVLNLMDQYPDFCFSQSQASVYKIVEEYDPELMPRIRARILEGRWEVTASAWVETDKNMPNTESLLRHIEYTRNYLSETWGIDASRLEIDFSPDTFGHSANIPEIDIFGGVKYMYHCRALDGEPSLYRWKAPSGKELLVYREQYWYNSGITPKVGLGLIDVARICAGFKTGLVVYGVGDHGGGPTRRDIENALEMAQWPIWPTVKFGSFAEFFHEAESVREKLPVIERELNFVFTGCYTTQARIKRANRKAEAALNEAEAWLSFSGRKLHRNKHEQAWQNVLYGHFHDIITGSCVPESRENAMGQFSKALAYANTQFSNSVSTIASMIDTSGIETDSNIALSQSEGAGGGFNMGVCSDAFTPTGIGFDAVSHNGVPNPERGCGKIRIFNIFNSTTTFRRTVAEITVWDWVGDLRRIQFKDIHGNPLRHQLIDQKMQVYWDHRFIRILVDVNIPAMGYTTVIMSEAEATGYPVYRQPERRSEYPYNNIVLENDLIRAEFHRVSGRLISLTDKENGQEYIRQDSSAGLSIISMETKTNNAWNIGQYLNSESMSAPTGIERLTDGPLMSGLRASYQWGQSKIKITSLLYAGEKAIRLCVETEWNERFGKDITPLLVFQVPHGFQTQKYMFDVPGGIQYRAPRNMDMPGLQFCAAIREDSTALALIPDSKYGYRADGDNLAVSLINTSRNPDPFPDRGMHVVNIALAISKDDPKLLEDTATVFNHPAYFMSNSSHPGTLPAEMSFLSFESRSTVLSAVIPTEQPNVYRVRYYENGGNDDTLILKFSKAPLRAISIDLRGPEVTSDLQISGNEVSVTAKAFSLGEIEFTF